MRIHYLQHVPYEDLAEIESWARERGHHISGTMMFLGDSPPPLDSFDWLVIMGGPMNIYQHDLYPWLAEEKRFIRRAIASGKITLGICLGGQLIADVLGGRVSPNGRREIGWHQVNLTTEACISRIFRVLPRQFIAFQWHGDTFSIPPGARRMAESEGCANQAFIHEKAIGLQFHLESSMLSVKHLLQNCSEELEDDGPFVQSSDEILARAGNLAEMNRLMVLLLDTIEQELGD